jgi:hypothetical protein
MSDENWYSATLRFFTLTASGGKRKMEDSVYLVRAEDFDDAFRKFLEVERRSETTYKNHLGEEVRHRLVEITTLDIIRSDNLDGVEVACTPVFEADPKITFDTAFDPEHSDPTQSI